MYEGNDLTEKSRSLSIEKDRDTVSLEIPYVELASNKDPIKLAVTLEKIPHSIDDGVELSSITIDRNGQKLRDMYRQSAALKVIPEVDRPRKLLEILRTNVHYAYNDLLEEVSKNNPELAKWIVENTGLDSSEGKPLLLSQIIDSGYGICRHLSVAMLALAKEAGMEGVLLSNGPVFGKPKYCMKNILRKDNGQPLFRLGKVDELVPAGHAWVELRTSDGQWIPVDPSSQLVGDTPEGMETFRDANYQAMVAGSVEINIAPGSVGHFGNQDLWFLPAEQQHTGTVEINSRSRTKDVKEYKGPLSVNLTKGFANRSINVNIIDIVEL